MVTQKEFRELIRVREGHLFHREGQQLEFKEQFNFGGLAEYFKDFAAFANNRGGLLVFGIQDSPRVPMGMSATSLNQFNKIDSAQISGYLLDIFSGDIRWEQSTFSVGAMTFGVFEIKEAIRKPIIARRNEGRDAAIVNGDIFYRYGGRTQNIQHAELTDIIESRVEHNNRQWLELMGTIGRVGPANAAIVDIERGLLEHGSNRVLMLDESLASRIKFIREGEFVEKNGAIALKLVGDVVPANQVEVIKVVREHVTAQYPLSAREVMDAVKSQVKCKEPEVYEVIKKARLKDNPIYCAYNFRTRKQELDFQTSGKLSNSIPSLYNQRAVDHVIQLIKDSQVC